jgi:hypothetical protein
MSFSTITAKLEVKPTDDEYEAIETTRWGNRDVYPVAHDKRVYGVYDYIAYWVSSVTSWCLSGGISADSLQGTCGMCLSSWTIGSSLIGIGLTAGQAMGAVVSCIPFLSFHRHVLTLTATSGRGHGDLFMQCIPEWYSRSQTPSGLWNASSLHVRTLGIILRRDAQRFSVVCLLWYTDVLRWTSLCDHIEFAQSQLLAHAQHAARKVSHACNSQPIHELG